MTTALLSKSAFGRRVKLSEGRIRQLVHEGMPSTDGKIDPAAADDWIRENLDPERRERPKRFAELGAASGLAAAPFPAPRSAAAPAQAAAGPTVADVRREKLEFELELARLNLRKRQGELIDRLEAENFTFEKGRQYRDSWLGWLARTAPALAAKLSADPQLVFAELDRLVRAHLVELSEAP